MNRGEVYKTWEHCQAEIWMRKSGGNLPGCPEFSTGGIMATKGHEKPQKGLRQNSFSCIFVFFVALDFLSRESPPREGVFPGLRPALIAEKRPFRCVWVDRTRTRAPNTPIRDSRQDSSVRVGVRVRQTRDSHTHAPTLTPHAGSTKVTTRITTNSRNHAITHSRTHAITHWQSVESMNALSGAARRLSEFSAADWTGGAYKSQDNRC